MGVTWGLHQSTGGVDWFDSTKASSLDVFSSKMGVGFSLDFSTTTKCDYV
jgi:cold shock CspA family protein